MTISRTFLNLRIRYKLILSYCLCFILIFMAGSSIIYVRVRDTMIANLESEMESRTAMILKLVKSSADLSIRNHLRAIAEKNHDMVSYFYDRCQKGFLTEENAWEKIREVLQSQAVGKTGYLYVINSMGKALIHPRKEVEGQTYDFPFIREMTRKKTGFLEYDWKNPDEPHALPKAQYYIYFAPWDWIIAATSYRSEFLHLMKVGDLEESINAMRVGISGYSAIIDGAGNVVFHPKLKGNLLEMKNPAMVSFAREVIQRRSGRIEYSWQNPGESKPAEKIAIFNYIPEYDWIVLSTVYINDFFMPLERVTRLFTVISLASILLTVLVSIKLGKVITRPIEDLTAQMGSYSQGMLPGTITVMGTDETGQLSASFNRFLLNLRDEMKSRKRAEQALRKSEEMHRAILEGSPNPIVLYDSVGNVLFINQAFTRVFGWKLDEITGRRLAFVPPENQEETSRAIEIIKTEQDRYIFESRRLTRSGDILDVSISTAVFKNKTGKFAGMVVNLTDITHIKSTDRELRSARNYITGIINSMPSILVSVNNREEVTQWNHEAEKRTGIPWEQARGCPLMDVLPQIESLRSRIKLAIARGTVETSSKVRLAGIEGGSVFDITVYPLVSDQDSGAAVLITDISRQVAVEEMMIQSDKMLSVGGLAAGMAHEINNPLAGIMQSSQVIINRLREPLPANETAARECGISLDAVRRYMEKRNILDMAESIRSAGARAARIVENMLSFSRKSGQSPSEHSIQEILDSTVELAENDYHLKTNYDFRAISVVRHYAPDMPKIMCERSKIQQVFFNILQNGAQVMAEQRRNGQDGRIPCFTLRLSREGAYVRIDIEDNGPGMPDEVRKRVFEPFFTTKNVGQGTGLGLSVSYFIITDDHGGTIEVESAQGKGTCFVIRLPISPSA